MRENPQIHTARMQMQYAGDIVNAVKNTKWVLDDNVNVAGVQGVISCSGLMQAVANLKHNCGVTEVHLIADGTTNALYSYYEHYGYNSQERAVVLNFASSTNPGGGFITGSMAQEEALCGESNLFNILSALGHVYDLQRKNTKNSLYIDSLLYTPCVIFEDAVHGKWYLADVITCAAPNRRAALRHEDVSVVDVEKTLYNRLDMILAAAAVYSSCKCLILGAYGCGVFGNDVDFVANSFMKLHNSKYSCLFKTVVYAIPDKTSANYKAFENVLV